MDFEPILKVTGTIIGTVTTLFIFYKKAVKPWLTNRKKEIAAAAAQRAEMIEGLSQLKGVIETVNIIKKQVMPNGGGSITDSLKRIETKFDEVDAKFDSIEENNRIFYNMQGIPFWVSDAAGLTTYVSPNLCKMIERSESELLGNQWISCLIKSDEHRISSEWKRSISEQRPFDEVYKFKGQDNDILVHGLAFHKKSKNGEYKGTIGTLSINAI